MENGLFEAKKLRAMAVLGRQKGAWPGVRSR